MTGPFTRRPDDDPTNVLAWLAGRGEGRKVQEPLPAPITVPPQADVDPAPPERVLPAEPRPKADPVKPTHCAHCRKPLPALRSAASRFCDRYCARDARRARATELPRY
jgi:hypothetical protein